MRTVLREMPSWRAISRKESPWTLACCTAFQSASCRGVSSRRDGGSVWLLLAAGSSTTGSGSRLARASETRKPARHWVSISSLARGCGAAAIRACTSWASRYSGRVLPFPGVFVAIRPFWGGFPGRGAYLRQWWSWRSLQHLGLFCCIARMVNWPSDLGAHKCNCRPPELTT